MLLDTVTMLKHGDRNGNGMLLRFRLPSGLEIYGLPTPNFYEGEWDLGPTWNYLVLADEPFLVDAGRFGQTDLLTDMLAAVGFSPRDVRFVLLSHGHEDHDGGVAEFSARSGGRIVAHEIYDRLCRFYPDLAWTSSRKEYPARCWNCFMPDWFVGKHCLAYHQANNRLKVEPIASESATLARGVKAIHTPGHSPDALCLQLGDEVLLTGDTILPEITPWPTTLKLGRRLKPVLKPGEESLFGLAAYLKTLKELGTGLNGSLMVLPSHRLYYGEKWNEVVPGQRIEELISHHVQRCGDILKMLRDRPLTIRAVAEQYFPENQLKGPGIFMAENEVLSHLELMEVAGDVAALDGTSYSAMGSSAFERLIQSL
ncbi:MAG: MBL fold metallo-hydrolase [Thermodesulfobacteriota bacterium]